MSGAAATGTTEGATPAFRLPRDAYRSPAWLEHEHEALFERTWALVGDEAALAQPGRYRTVQAGSASLVVVRGHDGELRAFHNLCRHRGMELVQGCGRAEHLACPYHAWRFGLDGTLALVPQRADQFPGLDPSRWGLLPASVATWEGMVFVHADPGAPPLGEALGELPAHIGSVHPGQLVEVAAVDLEGGFNWKLFVENHIDVYHLWYLHAETLGGFDHPRFEHRQLGRNWASWEPPRRGAERRAGGVEIAHLAERDRLGIGAHLVFPNILMAAEAEYFATYAVVPVSPTRSRVELRIRAEPDADPTRLLAQTRAFIDEDVRACEGVQRAVGSSRFAVGPLARTHERTITAFHDHLLEALGRGAGQPVEAPGGRP